MEDKDIRKYAEMMKELGLTGLEINDNGKVMRLERNECLTQKSQQTVTYRADSEAPKKPEENYINITSPMVGVFYCAPAEDSEPYVKVGDTVHKGDVLCIIEAMKLMNEITAEADGTIAEVCIENNQTVDYGRVLFRLKKE
jgi:acetyl-CoA carboxylase, biotin carboxyl carrier protein